MRIVAPTLRTLGKNRVVSAHIYGHSLKMPAEHPIAADLAEFPQYNRPLGLAISAIAASSADNSAFAVIDVGANIGETIAIIEQHLPGRCSYLCVEADKGIAELCILNHTGNSRVQVEQCFIGEEEGIPVWLEDDGRANPATKLSAEKQAQDNSSSGRLVRLDTIAEPFAAAKGGLTLIKIDTEGYDFSVLRSAPNLLSTYKPTIYFEWFPKLLLGIHEEIWSGFDYLAAFGYRYFVFFTNRGDYYCEVSDPDHLFLRSLASIALSDESLGYFDVFASAQKVICDTLVENSIAILDQQRSKNE
jgi:FkbM family methyltransferase